MGGKVAAIAAAAAFLAPAAHAATSQVNPQIAGLQVALRARSLYLGPIDGVAGPMTSAGLHQFQRTHGLPLGVADIRTRIALGPLGRPLFGSRNIRLGDFGWDVSVLQFLLTRAGVYDGALDGYMDRSTAVALRHYQRTTRLTADGVLGPRTLAVMAHREAVPVRPRPTTTPRLKVYLVRPGDTLTGIAQHFRTSVHALAAANRLDPARPILIGQKLHVPAGAPLALASSSGVRTLLDYWSTRLGVDPHLVRALAWMESGFQTRLVSTAGARGVLQLLPSTRAYVQTVLLRRPVPRTVSGDVEAGVALIRHLLAAFHGDRRLALAAWYQGEHAVRVHGVYKVTKPFVADVLALQARM